MKMDMNPCSYCDKTALALAAQYDLVPSQVVPVKKKKQGLLVRCLCCDRRWVSRAKWTSKF